MSINVPDNCPRGLPCEPLSQILDDEDEGFICCGLNDGSTRVEKQDEFTFCFKGEHIDERSDWDKRDLISTIAIMSMALTVQANMENK